MHRNIPFIGRQQELEKLDQVASMRVASLVVLKGAPFPKRKEKLQTGRPIV